MVAVALLAPVAWLLGTFPSAQLVGRAHGRDILREGSGNPGASNVERLLGWRAGALVLLLDFAKGALAAGAGPAIGGRPRPGVLRAGAGGGPPCPPSPHGGEGGPAAGGRPPG